MLVADNNRHIMFKNYLKIISQSCGQVVQTYIQCRNKDDLLGCHCMSTDCAITVQTGEEAHWQPTLIADMLLALHVSSSCLKCYTWRKILPSVFSHWEDLSLDARLSLQMAKRELK